MSDLPTDRITPWNVVNRKQASIKQYNIILCCMVTRCLHIEVIEDMSTFSFMNSLKRFLAIRGPVKQIQSDRGVYFVGAVNELQIQAANVEDPMLTHYLDKEGITWLFNTPYSSHMGGSRERLVGVTRRILDNMMFDNKMLILHMKCL